MDKLKMRGMKRNAINERLRRFGRMVFSIADHGMADRRELRPNLILQSCDQLDAN
jgi:hypothetical protein